MYIVHSKRAAHRSEALIRILCGNFFFSFNFNFDLDISSIYIYFFNPVAGCMQHGLKSHITHHGVAIETSTMKRTLLAILLTSYLPANFWQKQDSRRSIQMPSDLEVQFYRSLIFNVRCEAGLYNLTRWFFIISFHRADLFFFHIG